MVMEGCLEEVAGEGGKSSASFALEGGQKRQVIKVEKYSVCFPVYP